MDVDGPKPPCVDVSRTMEVDNKVVLPRLTQVDVRVTVEGDDRENLANTHRKVFTSREEISASGSES